MKVFLTFCFFFGSIFFVIALVVSRGTLWKFCFQVAMAMGNCRIIIVGLGSGNFAIHVLTGWAAGDAGACPGRDLILQVEEIR